MPSISHSQLYKHENMCIFLFEEKGRKGLLQFQFPHISLFFTFLSTLELSKKKKLTDKLIVVHV